MQLHLAISNPIVMLLALYLTVVYIILFTFSDGYAYIFRPPYQYHLSQGLTNIIWLAILVGAVLGGLVYRWTKQEIQGHRSNKYSSARDSAVCDDGRLGAGLHDHLTVLCRGRSLDTGDPELP